MTSLNELLSKSKSDPILRERLMSCPREVLHEIGEEIPETTRIEVFESEPNEIHLVIGSRTGSIAINSLMQRAASDESYCQRLKGNPRKCMEEAIGGPLPENLRFVVHEQPENLLRVILPCLTPESSSPHELSEAELSEVSGGRKGLWTRIVDWMCDDHTSTWNNEQHGTSHTYVDHSATYEQIN
jgi:hypothetical protein